MEKLSFGGTSHFLWKTKVQTHGCPCTFSCFHEEKITEELTSLNRRENDKIFSIIFPPFLWLPLQGKRICFFSLIGVADEMSDLVKFVEN